MANAAIAAATESPKKVTQNVTASTEIIRFEEDDTGRLAPFDFVPEEGDRLRAAMTEAQRKMIVLDVPLEVTAVREVGKGKFAAYLPVGFYIDTLNKLTLWNWSLEIDERRLDTRTVTEWGDMGPTKVAREELFVCGHLVLYVGVGQARQIRIPCEGGAIVRDNRGMTYADFYKIARADMIKTGATVLGIGLGLKDPRRKEEAMVYHGKAEAPDFRDMTNLRNACGADDNDVIIDRLLSMGIPAEAWELQSKARVEALTAAAKRLK